MSLLFIDSFDHWNNGTDKYLSGGTAIVAGRHGNGYNGGLRVALAHNHPRCIVGAAIKTSSTAITQLFGASGGTGIFSSASRNDGSLEVSLFGGSAITSAVDLIRVNQWHYIELDITVQTTATPSGSDILYKYQLGPIKAYIDGAKVLDHAFIGDSTVFFLTDPGPGKWNRVDITEGFFGAMDDLYIADGEGSGPWNAPVGDIEIGVIRPNAPGAAAEWTAFGGVPNWDTNNDVNPDDDTTYVLASTAPKSDLYEMEDVNTGNHILGAQVLVNARRTEEGFGELATLLRHAGVTQEFTARALASTYFYRNREIFVQMPNGAPLTDANMNTIQAGFKRTL